MMFNKKAAIPTEEIRGIFTYMFVAVIAILIFYGCSVNEVKKDSQEREISQSQLESIKTLNLFLETELDDGKKVSDRIVELYIEGYLEKEMNKIVKDFFSDIEIKGIILLFNERGQVYSSIGVLNPSARYIPSQAELAVLSKSGEDIEFITVVFQPPREED